MLRRKCKCRIWRSKECVKNISSQCTQGVEPQSKLMLSTQHINILEKLVCHTIPCIRRSYPQSKKIICNLCPFAATLVIKGPTKSVVAGESVEIECLYTDSEFNISQVRFEFSYDVSGYMSSSAATLLSPKSSLSLMQQLFKHTKWCLFKMLNQWEMNHIFSPHKHAQTFRWTSTNEIPP